MGGGLVTSSTLVGVRTTAGLLGSGSSVLSMYSPPTNASGGGVSTGTDCVCVCVCVGGVCVGGELLT